MENVFTVSCFILGVKKFSSRDRSSVYCRVTAYMEDSVVSFFVPADLYGAFSDFVKSEIDIRIKVGSYDGLPSWKFVELA